MRPSRKATLIIFAVSVIAVGAALLSGPAWFSTSRSSRPNRLVVIESTDTTSEAQESRFENEADGKRFAPHTNPRHFPKSGSTLLNQVPPRPKANERRLALVELRAVEIESEEIKDETTAITRRERSEEAIQQPDISRTQTVQTAAEFWMWLGVGANYQTYRQTLSSFYGDSKFQNLSAPTCSVRGGFQGRRWGTEFSFSTASGEIKSSRDAKVINGHYSWNTISLEGSFKITNASKSKIRVGVQNHSIPFVVLDPAAAEISVVQNTLSLFTVGVERSFRVSPKLRSEWLLRYQLPISSSSEMGSRFSVSPKLAFDGSLGGVYQLTENVRLGLFWYGQWHNYKFDYKSSVQSYSGSQSLFYSNLEFRIGMEF